MLYNNDNKVSQFKAVTVMKGGSYKFCVLKSDNSKL